MAPGSGNAPGSNPFDPTGNGSLWSSALNGNLVPVLTAIGVLVPLGDCSNNDCGESPDWIEKTITVMTGWAYSGWPTQNISRPPDGTSGNANDFITKHVCVGESRVIGAGAVTDPPSVGAFPPTKVTSGTAAINPTQFFPGVGMLQAKAAMVPYLNTIEGDVASDPIASVPLRSFQGVTDVIGPKSARDSLAQRFPGPTLEINGVPEPAGASLMSYVNWTMSVFVPCPTGTKELIAY
jgi:hypothetical protein